MLARTSAEALAAVLVTTTAAAQGAAAKPEWSGSAGAGFIQLSGNASTTSFNASASGQRETNGWILATKATAVYGRARPVDRTLAAQTVALGATGQLRADRKLGKHATVFVAGGVDADHVASLEYRGFGDAGLGWIWIDRKGEGDRALFLRTDAGVRYAYDSRWQYYATEAQPEGDLPDVELLAPRVGATFRWALSKDTQLSEEAEFLADVSGDERYLAKSLTKLTTRIVSPLSLGVSYGVTWDSEPAPGKVDTDTALAVTLETTF